MKTVVVDASVAVKWFLPEEGSDQAETLLGGKFRLIAPDLLWTEVANVLWKIARRGSIMADEAHQMLRDASAMPVEITESLPLLPEALRIATSADRSVYDSLYIAMAVQEKANVVTADQRLANALTNTEWASRVVPIDDM
ncbi:MAG: type II toxin-antitoxin system VapC family toxin [Phycisphaerales bacterium]|nr:type II toxin-antitoxin system VapC family toxin [Planctomycetota bacterium]MCH8507644.1 type II toxin-antitoxin system VapC family toxin [Phycisphaerales bacterium]